MRCHYPLVSVVIPTYNRPQFLRRALQSVLTQSYSNLEVIVVDDYSAEDARTILSRFADRRLRYLRHDQNLGGSAARNTGIRASRGDFVAFLDDDDEWFPGKLSLQVELAQSAFCKNPQVVYTGLQHVAPEGQVKRIFRPTRQGEIWIDLLYGNYVGSTSTVLVPRQVLVTAGGFDTNLPSCQDWDLWIRLALRCSFIAVAEPLVRHHVSNKRIDTNLTAQIQGRLQLLAKIKPHLTVFPWWQRRRILANHYHLLAGHYARHHKVKEAIRYSGYACTQNPLNLRAWFSLVKVVTT